jgi:hypothetical protein
MRFGILEKISYVFVDGSQRYVRKIHNIIFCQLQFSCSGVQGKNNEYHIVDKVKNSFIVALIFDLIDYVVFVVFALYSSV